jgi:flavin-dependent dehydrogenase
MGVWDAIEAANFPVKIGATYRWGSSSDLWDFNFLGSESYRDTPRPARFDGERTLTAFQVDRGPFDLILLNHAMSMGAEVRQGTKVADVSHSGHKITGLVLENGDKITARYYIDGSGSSGLFRRTLGIEVFEPNSLRNIAIWRYWQNAKWAVTLGESGTRIQVISLKWGWVWIIPISPTRTSIGLVVPVEYFKKTGMKPEEIYEEALQSEPNIRRVLENAEAEPGLNTTRDWSFISSQLAGENWFLVGESGGFADPILSAGVSLAVAGAEKAALTILELERGTHDPKWLLSEFEKDQVRGLKTHIAFANYWYAANAHFTDLIEYTGTIANEAGLPLRGDDAWFWLGTAGFVQLGPPGLGGFSLSATSWVVNEFGENVPDWQITQNNLFDLDLEGAEKVEMAAYMENHIRRLPCYRRDSKVMPDLGPYRHLIETLKRSNRLDSVMAAVARVRNSPADFAGLTGKDVLEALEAMIHDGWVRASRDPAVPLLQLKGLADLKFAKRNTDNEIKF